MASSSSRRHRTPPPGDRNVVEAIRYGFLGVSDVSPWVAFGVLTVMAAALFAWAQHLFSSGRKLKP